MNNSIKKLGLALIAAGVVVSTSANASPPPCGGASWWDLQQAAKNVVRGLAGTGGFGLNMWATIVDPTGKVCAVVNTGTKGAESGNSQWLGSRVISAQKANTANAFSLDGVSISTGSLYAAVQPGGSLFGLQESNPVNAAAAYDGNPHFYGRQNDPLTGKRVGGVNVFGGGIALYKNGVKVGALGVSGDTSCTDHAFAWKVREALGLDDGTPGGFELLNIVPAGGAFAALGDHPTCFQDTGIDNQAVFGFK